MYSLNVPAGAHASLAASVHIATIAAAAGSQRLEFIELHWQIELRIEVLAWVGEGAEKTLLEKEILAESP